MRKIMLPERFLLSETAADLCDPNGFEYIKVDCTDEIIPFYDPHRCSGYVLCDRDIAALDADRRFIFVARHGETDWNAAGRMQGREDIPMNETGERQSFHCANRLLSVFNAKGIRVGRVYSSPLKRAVRTAEIMAEVLEIPEILRDDGLIERDYARLSGLTPSQRKETFPGKKAEEVDGIEPISSSAGRFALALGRIADGMRGANTLIISHGGILNAFVSKWTAGKIGSNLTLTTNCCINVFSQPREGGKITLEAFNLTPDTFMNLRRK